MKIAIINGPNLNLLGKRETALYGTDAFETIFAQLQQQFPQVQFSYFQSNVEGELINALHEYGFSADGIILNPAGYTHTSVAIGDAIAAINAPVIEVHLTNIHAREAFRKISHVSAQCNGTISGLGAKGYALAVTALLS